ncbi:hypothetical protein KSP40_PGU004635 [Platanthera guangdongensis]|uniref:Uncharacterized protein n=1 Tax=Platanthera guangdongensis TaxID=2320717 RepID=A0ABR2LL27_9ASPA
MRQIEQHNEKRATFADQKRENDDYSYDISLDEDFVTALEYGMPPASGMLTIQETQNVCPGPF